MMIDYTIKEILQHKDITLILYLVITLTSGYGFLLFFGRIIYGVVRKIKGFPVEFGVIFIYITLLYLGIFIESFINFYCRSLKHIDTTIYIAYTASIFWPLMLIIMESCLVAIALHMTIRLLRGK